MMKRGPLALIVTLAAIGVVIWIVARAWKAIALVVLAYVITH